MKLSNLFFFFGIIIIILILSIRLMGPFEFDKKPELSIINSSVSIPTAKPEVNSSSDKDQAEWKRIDEVTDMNKSNDEYWWLSSGGYAYSKGNIIKTIQGDLPQNDERRIRYAENNPGETDNGYHPQNIFRLVTRQTWQQFSQQVYFNIGHYYTSQNSNRAASNGIFLFNHYINSNNIYYTGIRVDGTVIIKKKINGVYYTMTSNTFLPGVYNRDNNQNLIPINRWIGIKSEIKNREDGTVLIAFFVDLSNNGNWQLVATALDDGKSFGGNVFTDGHGGIRSDFMDVQFDRYHIEQMK